MKIWIDLVRTKRIKEEVSFDVRSQESFGAWRDEGGRRGRSGRSSLVSSAPSIREAWEDSDEEDTSGVERFDWRAIE